MTTGEGSLPVRLHRALVEAHPSWEELHTNDFASLPSGGWESDLFTCTADYTEGGTRHRRNLIVKAYLGDFAREKARNEFNGMRQLQASVYPVPEVFAFDAGDPLLTKPFVVMERVDGQRLSDVLREAPAETQMALLSHFCELFFRLHSLDWRPFVPNPDDYSPEGFVARSIDSTESFMRKYGRDEFNPVLAWLRERSRQVVCEQLSVVHYDFHPSNLLLKPGGQTVVIDWPSVQVSDSRFDLGWTLMLVGAYRDPEARELILHEYERIAGSPVEDIGFFEAVAAVNRLFDVAVTLHAGAERLGMRPEAAEQMRKNAPTLNYVYALLQATTSISIPQIEELLASLTEK
jgi:aminoglycoside phosphotransferase (APT) family kinase protein